MTPVGKGQNPFFSLRDQEQGWRPGLVPNLYNNFSRIDRGRGQESVPHHVWPRPLSKKTFSNNFEST